MKLGRAGRTRRRRTGRERCCAGRHIASGQVPRFNRQQRAVACASGPHITHPSTLPSRAARPTRPSAAMAPVAAASCASVRAVQQGVVSSRGAALQPRRGRSLRHARPTRVCYAGPRAWGVVLSRGSASRAPPCEGPWLWRGCTRAHRACCGPAARRRQGPRLRACLHTARTGAWCARVRPRRLSGVPRGRATDPAGRTLSYESPDVLFAARSRARRARCAQLTRARSRRRASGTMRSCAGRQAGPWTHLPHSPAPIRRP